MIKQTLNIGLFGLGVVGKGLLDVLQNSNLPGIAVKKICVKTPGKPREVAPEKLTFNASDILDDPSINVVVETISGSEDAFHIVSQAMRKGKHVVTANKKMVADNLSQLLDLQDETGVSLLYESAACGGIPIVRTIEEHFGSEPMEQISGIFNGTSNFILSKMFRDRLDFAVALKQAQDLGFAELDPSSDVDGLDAKYKLILLTAHSHGVVASPETILHFGIRHLRTADIEFARQQGLKIKLLPVCKRTGTNKLALYVMPGLVGEKDGLYHVEDEFNGVQLNTAYSGRQFFSGRGAGGFPTGSALLSDLVSLQRGYRYPYQKHRLNGHTLLDEDIALRVYARAPRTILPEMLPFDTMEYAEQSAGHHCIIGELKLKNLRKQREYLHEQGVFIMRMPQDFEN